MTIPSPLGWARQTAGALPLKQNSATSNARFGLGKKICAACTRYFASDFMNSANESATCSPLIFGFMTSCLFNTKLILDEVDRQLRPLVATWDAGMDMALDIEFIHLFLERLTKSWVVDADTLTGDRRIQFAGIE